jgi:hypothetical protein
MLIALRFRRVSSGQYPLLLLLPLFDVAPPPCEFPSDGHPVKASETSMRNTNNSLVAFIVISSERDRRALPDYWLRHVSYALEAVTVCVAGFLRLVHAGNKIDVLGIVGVLSQRPIRGAESTRRIAGTAHSKRPAEPRYSIRSGQRLAWGNRLRFRREGATLRSRPELLFIGWASGLFRVHRTTKTARATPCERTQRMHVCPVF